ncbi:hypothetical protein NPIL_319131 [Nephila pilipes]|uniref:Uncharacterized protein n=1 Tax=Nephila pilipes TaxID=299642 RepID=A0A8X6MVM8_NEPPI|nr:hypothetical protein NPIL_319131 [Nephila pilipes]
MVRRECNLCEAPLSIQKSDTIELTAGVNWATDVVVRLVPISPPSHYQSERVNRKQGTDGLEKRREMDIFDISLTISS